MCAYVRTRIKEFKPARNAVFAILCFFESPKLQNKTFRVLKNCKIRRFTCVCQKKVVPLQPNLQRLTIKEDEIWPIR